MCSGKAPREVSQKVGRKAFRDGLPERLSGRLAGGLAGALPGHSGGACKTCNCSMTSLRSSPVSPLTQASRCRGMRHPRPFWLKCSASWSRGSCASWWALAGLFAGLFAADSHAEAQQKAIAAPAHQAGVVLEASGSTFIRPFPRGDTDLQTS